MSTHKTKQEEEEEADEMPGNLSIIAFFWAMGRGFGATVMFLYVPPLVQVQVQGEIRCGYLFLLSWLASIQRVRGSTFVRFGAKRSITN
jgi:hypothetical protein